MARYLPIKSVKDVSIAYMYFLDGKRGIDTANVFRTENFAMPLQRKRDGSFKYPSGMEMYVGLSTDFFVEEADVWRDEVSENHFKQRPDMVFRLLTKRAHRIENESAQGTQGERL